MTWQIVIKTKLEEEEEEEEEEELCFLLHIFWGAGELASFVRSFKILSLDHHGKAVTLAGLGQKRSGFN